MSTMWSAWRSVLQANEVLRKSPQLLDLIADNARAFVAQVKQRGFDRRWIRAFLKKGKQEAEMAKELAELLKRLQQWLRSVDRNPQTLAELRQEFQEFLTSARERQRGEQALGEIVDARGQVSAAVRLPPSNRALAKVLGTNMDKLENTLMDYILMLEKLGLSDSALDSAAKEAKQILSGFLRAWETRRPAQRIEEIMSSFAQQHEARRQEIHTLRKLHTAGQPGAAEAAEKIRREIVEHGRDRFASARKQVLQEVLDDPELRERLESVGLVVDQNRSTISFELDLGKRQLPGDTGQLAGEVTSVVPNLKIKLNIDHAKIDFADAIDTWINTGATDALHPVIAGSNMRIVTGLENQVFLTILKKDAEKWGQSLSSSTTSAEALYSTAAPSPDPLTWETPAWENNVDGVVRKIEALTGQRLGWRERDAVRDYIDMAMQITRP